MHNPLKKSAVAACALCASIAGAQNYPAKPVRVVVSFPAGSGADIVARTITPRLTEVYGQQFVIDNRAGASGNLGAEIAARAVPDGYTLLFTPASVASSQALYQKLGYNLQKDLDPISIIASAPFVLVVHPSLPVKTVKDLIAMAKARPGQLLYASTGNGGSPHLATELFKLQAKIDIGHIPYKGTPPAVTDLIAGQLTMVAETPPTVLPHVQSKKIRPIAVSMIKRIPQLPDVATVDEQGIKGYDLNTWTSLVAPIGTPEPILERLNAEITKIIAQPDVQKRLVDMGFIPVGNSREAFGAFLKSELASWEKIVKASGAKVD